MLVSCRKKEETPPDYRPKYVGEFLFEEAYYKRTWLGPVFHEERDTLMFLGQIDTLGTNQLKIRYKANYSSPNIYCVSWPISINGLLHPEIDEAAVLHYPEINSCSNYYNFKGEFHWNDSVHMRITVGQMRHGSQEIVITGRRWN